MYFYGDFTIQYYMLKITHIIRKTVFFVLLFAIIITVPVLTLTGDSGRASEEGIPALTLWQIDNFEGGKGSRASYLQNVADRYYKISGCYINVVSISVDAVKININNGNIPDIISYGAGITGIESIVENYICWCNGGYCFLSVTESSDFSDISAENTIINGGTGNFAKAAAILSGLNGANADKPTGAYVKLINGNYKYLLGTQRDIYRLKTRGVAFKIKPVTEFNDLYQNISISCKTQQKRKLAERFIDYLLGNNDLSKLGLMCGGRKLYDDEMGAMEGLSYECKIISPISESTKNEITSAINECDKNKLKNLLK